MSGTFKVRVAGTEVECRRPTHGELDVSEVKRLIGVVAVYQKKVSDEEESPQPGAAVRIANWLMIAEEGVNEVARLVRRAFQAIALPPKAFADALALAQGNKDMETLALVDAGVSLLEAIGADEGVRPKS